MADGVSAEMNPPQATTLQPVADRTLGDPEVQKLAASDHAVLDPGEPGNGFVVADALRTNVDPAPRERSDATCVTHAR